MGVYLEVTMHASIEIAKCEIGRVHFAGNVVHKAGVVDVKSGGGRVHWPVSLVFHNLQDVLERVAVDVLSGQPVRWDVEVGRGGVAKHHNTSHLGAFAIFVFVSA